MATGYICEPSRSSSPSKPGPATLFMRSTISMIRAPGTRTSPIIIVRESLARHANFLKNPQAPRQNMGQGWGEPPKTSRKAARGTPQDCWTRNSALYCTLHGTRLRRCAARHTSGGLRESNAAGVPLHAVGANDCPAGARRARRYGREKPSTFA